MNRPIVKDRPMIKTALTPHVNSEIKRQPPFLLKHKLSQGRRSGLKYSWRKGDKEEGGRRDGIVNNMCNKPLSPYNIRGRFVIYSKMLKNELKICSKCCINLVHNSTI
jgi:hypothetical protein